MFGIRDSLNTVIERPGFRKILVNISWLYFDKAVRLGIGLVVGIWVARYLGPDNYGLLNYGLAIVALFSILVKLGLQSIVVRDLVNNAENTNETIGTSVILQIISALLAYGLLTITIGYLQPENMMARSVVALLGITLFRDAFDTAKYWFEAKVMSKYVAWLSNIVFLLLSAVRIVLILAEAPLIAFVWVTVVDAVLVSLGTVLLFFWFGSRPLALRFSLGRARRLLSDSWPLLLSGAAVIVYVKVDVLMLGQMVGDEAVGIYSAATRLSELWYFIPMIIVTSVFPAILNAKKKDEALYYRRLQQLFDLMVWMSVIVALPMTFASTPIVRLLFGEAYSAAGPVLAVHIWAAIFIFLGLASGKWFVAEGRQILNLQRSFAGALANIGLNLLLIPKYGPLGAAWATVISYGISAFMMDITRQVTRRLFFMKLSTLNPLLVAQRLRQIAKLAEKIG